MTIPELLAKIRAIYATQLSAVIAAHPNCVSEGAYRTSSGDLAFEGASALPMRLDVLPVTEEGPGNPIMVDSPSRLQFTPIDWSESPSLRVTLAPFIWDYCQVFVPDIPANFSFEPIKQWFLRWFDADDANTADENGLYGVVHYLSEPDYKEEGVSFTVDFGSAPVDALEDLFEALAAAGATIARISSP